MSNPSSPFEPIVEPMGKADDYIEIDSPEKCRYSSGPHSHVGIAPPPQAHAICPVCFFEVVQVLICEHAPKCMNLPCGHLISPDALEQMIIDSAGANTPD